MYKYTLALAGADLYFCLQDHPNTIVADHRVTFAKYANGGIVNKDQRPMSLFTQARAMQQFILEWQVQGTICGILTY